MRGEEEGRLKIQRYIQGEGERAGQCFEEGLLGDEGGVACRFEVLGSKKK